MFGTRTPPEGLNATSLGALSPEQREAFLRSLSNAEASALRWDWRFWARPDQLPPPGDWRIWLVLAGRGWGKTKTISQWCLMQIEAGLGRGAAIARTAADLRDVLVEGPAGILACSPPWSRPAFEPSKRRIVFPNGATIHLFSAEESDALRGPEHAFLVADEIVTWDGGGRAAFDMAVMGLRLGDNPRMAIATTPRPTPLIRELVARPDVHVTRGTTWQNASNLPPSFLTGLRERYAGTRLGRQELEAELLTDTPGALWTYAMIEQARHPPVDRGMLRRIVVGIDPAGGTSEEAGETGIIVAGRDTANNFYVLEDGSLKGTPHEWASRAIALYRKWQADAVAIETNFGGDMVTATLRMVDANVRVKTVRATRGKLLRAEPVAALFEQGRARHCGAFPALENQMTSYSADWVGPSPDRLDAMVWAAHELIVDARVLQIF